MRLEINSFFDKHGLSQSFIATGLGGLFLILSGLIVDQNYGRALTGALIFFRGTSSEIIRKKMTSKGFSEPVSAFPGITIASLMNWPALLSASSYFEALAYGLAVIVLNLKFMQYLPSMLEELVKNKPHTAGIDLAAKFVTNLNNSFLNQINKHAGFTIIISGFFFLMDTVHRQDLYGFIALFFLIYGGLSLAIKTRIELAN